MLWIKAFHIIFVICWFAGLFYLPRLFVNHAMTDSPDVHTRLCDMERRLYRFMTPFAVITVVLGLFMAISYWNIYRHAYWLHIKLILVLFLIIYHGICGRIVKQFATGKNHRSHRFYRFFNEIPAVLLFIIIILAVVRPI